MRRSRARRLLWLSAALVAATAIELVRTPATDIAFTTASAAQGWDLSMRRAGAAILANGPPRPKILNLSVARASYPLPGEIWLSDPFLYQLLWASGQLSSAPVVDALRTKGVDGVLAPRASLAADDDVSRALRERYRIGLDLGWVLYLVPQPAR